MGVNERRFSPIRRWNVVVVFFSRNVFVFFFFRGAHRTPATRSDVVDRRPVGGPDTSRHGNFWVLTDFFLFFQ